MVTEGDPDAFRNGRTPNQKFAAAKKSRVRLPLSREINVKAEAADPWR
jgi:hypothetical protein